MLGWLLLVLAALVGVFLFLNGNDEAFSGLEGGEIVYILVFGALALFYVLSLVGDYRGRAAEAVRHVIVWLGLTGALLVGYAYREELSVVAYRVAGEVLPPGQVITLESRESGERAVRLRRQPNGQFVARGVVNGTNLSLLVDTGASTVVLKSTDAERIGVDTGSLSYSVPVSTANGTTYAAPIRLKSVAVGPIELRDVEALIAKPGNLSENLLGMTFLRRLRSYEFSGDFLTIRG